MGLTDLPAEIQTHLASWLFRKQDLANTCLVCKQLYEVATPLLYRSITIDVDVWKADMLTRLFDYGHRAHRHIRRLSIDSKDYYFETDALQVAKNAIQVLPRNGLTSFS